MSPSKASPLVTPLELTAIGGCGGVLEVMLMQPMVGIKNALQEGRPVPRNPLHLYRGLVVNAASIAPITASQFGTNKLMEQLITGYTGKRLTSTGKFTSTAVAGAVSALIGSPSEMIIIHQQKSGRSLLAETKHFLSTYGFLPIFRALGACMARESVYTAGYLGLCPILRDALEQHPAMQDYPKGAPMLIGGVVGGVFAAAASHPADTVKTKMQASMYSNPEHLTIWSTAKSIYSRGGITAFWTGLTPRMTRIIAATFILNTTRTKAVDYLETHRS